MADPIVTPPHPPLNAPDPLPSTVPLNPPMVGTASPFERVDGQNRDLILESIRSWARGPLIDWAGNWQRELIAWVGSTEGWLDEWNAEVIRYVQEVLDAIIDNSITVQDPVVAQLINDSLSATSIALEGKYERKSSIYVLPEYFGAVGDGVADDTPAIQSAIDSAAVSGKFVYLRAGVYRLVKPVGLDYFLKVYPHIAIGGPGTLKVSDNSGDYRSIFAGSSIGADLSGLRFDGLRVDENSANNPVITFTNYPRYVLFAGAGDGITIKGCHFANGNSINTISINGVNVSNVIISENVFDTVGQSLTMHDHSTIYTHGTGVTITNNVFNGVAGGLGATTAIETHGSVQVVTDNRIQNYLAGMNITGISATLSRDIVVSGNTITNTLIGIDLWSRLGGLSACRVYGNTILLNRDIWIRGLSDYARGIMIDPGNDADINGLSIFDNVIEFLPSVTIQNNELSGAGISIWNNSPTPVINDTLITGNLIKGAHSSGIRLAATLNRVKVGGNQIVNPGSSADPTLASFYTSGITMVGVVRDVEIANNLIYDTRTTHKMSTGVMTSVTSAARVATKDNTVVCYDGANLAPVTPTVGSGKSFMINESMETFVAPGWARVGSRVFEKSSGSSYVQTGTPDGFAWSVRAL